MMTPCDPSHRWQQCLRATRGCLADKLPVLTMDIWVLENRELKQAAPGALPTACGDLSSMYGTMRKRSRWSWSTTTSAWRHRYRLIEIPEDAQSLYVGSSSAANWVIFTAILPNSANARLVLNPHHYPPYPSALLSHRNGYEIRPREGPKPRRGAFLWGLTRPEPVLMSFCACRLRNSE